MDANTLTIVISLVAVVIAAYSVWRANRAGTPITGELLTTTLQQSQATATEIAAIVKAGVFAAEQLKSTGKIPDNNAAFNYAFTFAQKLLPDLERATLVTFIESFVPLANQAYGALPNKPTETTMPAMVQPVHRPGGTGLP